MKCALTGGNGYVGSRIRAALVSAGHELVDLNRRESATPFELGKEVPTSYFQGCNALIHCAYDFSPRTWQEIQSVNAHGSIKLFNAAISSGVRRLIFISSISAYEGCRSYYGRAKLEVEQFVLAKGGAVIRPGLVYGDSAGGMVGSLSQAVKKALVPVVGAEQKMYLSNEEDLSSLVIGLLSIEKPPAGPILAANPTAWKFVEILKRLAAREKVSPRFLRLPWQAVWLGLKSAECLGLKLGFRSDSLISLAYPNPSPDFSLPPELGLSFRPFA